MVWLPLTGSLSGSQPRAFSPGPPHRGGRAFGRKTSRDVTRPSRAAVRGAFLAKGTRASTARNACHRLDLAVLPRGRSLRRSGARAWCPDSLSEPSRRTSWIDHVPAVGRARLGAASPALKARRARSPIPEGTPSLRWGPGTRGARPGGGPRSNRPMSAAHGFCFQDRTPSRLGALRTISPRCGSHRFTPMSSLGRVCRMDQSVFCPGTVPQTYLLTPRRFAGCPAEQIASVERNASASVARGTPFGRPSGLTREPRPPRTRPVKGTRRRFGPRHLDLPLARRPSRRPDSDAPRNAAEMLEKAPAVSPTLGARPRAFGPRDPPSSRSKLLAEQTLWTTSRERCADPAGLTEPMVLPKGPAGTCRALRPR